MNQIQNLKDVTSNVLENMFFLYEETTPNNYKEDYKYCSFINDPAINIRLLVGNNLGMSLTKNFLGTDLIQEADILDVMKEILNMIVGNYVGKFSINFTKQIPVPQAILLPSDFKLSNYDFEILFYESEPLLIAIGS